MSATQANLPHRRTIVAAGALTLLLALGTALVPGSPAFAAPPAFAGAVGVTGVRPGATSVPFGISDQTSASVDVATGNLLIQNSSLALVGVSGPVRVSQSYNSFGSSTGSTSSLAAAKWTLGLGGAGYLSQGSSGAIVYTDGDGAAWNFVPTAGSTTAYNSPTGFKRDLSKTVSGWTLTDRASRRVITFDGDGRPVSVADRNGNATAIGYTGSYPSSIVSTAGPVAARTATLTYEASNYTLTAYQSGGSLTRSVKYVKDASSNLINIVDAIGKQTTFAYVGGQLTQITAPTGQVTTVTYDSSGRVTSVAQANTTSGSPGTSVTRFGYSSATQTLVAGPNTNQSSAVSAVPHITYVFDATTKLVGSATDEMGRARAATYTPQSDIATSTTGSGSSSGTTTNEWAANNGDSQTKSTSPGGASVSATYGNTAPATQYLASGSTDSAGNSSTYTYNGAGNQLTSADAMASTATLTYNTDGTVSTSTAPGNGSNKTVYAYDSNRQLSTVTPVTGSSLGVRTFTYDDLGRTKTATDGRGITVTYGYDLQDRLLTTNYSDGTATVVNSYTDGGQISSRQDANGVTSYDYDQLGRLVSRRNSFAGGAITYGYDRASNLTSTADSRGTTTNAFDASGVVTTMTYDNGTGPQVLGFATDNRGRRTDTYLQTNAGNTVWKAHTHQDFDTTGRVIRVLAETNTGSAVVAAVDVTYCYNAASAAPTCATTAAGDRSKLQWQKDNLSGQVTSYVYDQAGRLTQAAQSGGTGANTYAYTYDSRGNRLTAAVSGATPSSQTFTANAANQISSSGYSYDGTGNLVADPAGTYGYSGAEQMTTVTKSGTTYSYKYAGSGQDEVLEQQSGSTTTQLVYGRISQIGQPVVEQAKVGSATAYIENDPVTGQPLMLRTASGAQALYVYTDTATPTALLADSGVVATASKFDPFGTAVVVAGSASDQAAQNPFTFSGGIQDRVTGWIHYGARWYDPATGRWTQQDTLDSPLDPANGNRYAYAGDDPINSFDPSGRYDFRRTAVVAGVAGVGSAIVGCIGAASAATVLTGVGGGAACVASVPGNFVAGALVGAGGDAVLQAFGY